MKRISTTVFVAALLTASPVAVAEEFTGKLIEMSITDNGVEFKLDRANQCGSNKYFVAPSDPQLSAYKKQLQNAAMNAGKVSVVSTTCSGDRATSTSVKQTTASN